MIKIDRGIVIENLITGERRLFFSDEDDLRIDYIKSCEKDFFAYTFNRYTENEKFLVFNKAWLKMKNIDKEVSGSGRTFDNSIKLSFDDFDYLMNYLYE